MNHFPFDPHVGLCHSIRVFSRVLNQQNASKLHVKYSLAMCLSAETFSPCTYPAAICRGQYPRIPLLPSTVHVVYHRVQSISHSCKQFYQGFYTSAQIKLNLRLIFQLKRRKRCHVNVSQRRRVYSAIFCALFGIVSEWKVTLANVVVLEKYICADVSNLVSF